MSPNPRRAVRSAIKHLLLSLGHPRRRRSWLRRLRQRGFHLPSPTHP